MVEALDALPLPPLSFQFNNRKLIQGFYRGLGLPDVTAAIRTIDKLDKLPEDAVAELLVNEAGATVEQAHRCLELATIRTPDTSFADRVRALGVADDLLEEGLTELAAVVEGCAAGGHRMVTVEANLRIARGLDYYTGTVVEIFMEGYERLKSVGGGGRYDALASDGRTTYPGVGVSFGVSRTLVPLLAEGVLTGSRAVPSAVLVAVTDEESRRRQRRGRVRPARQRRADRGVGGGAEVRQADPHGRAARHPLRPLPADRRHPRGQGHPLRRPVGRRPVHVDPTHRGPAPAGRHTPHDR